MAVYSLNSDLMEIIKEATHYTELNRGKYLVKVEMIGFYFNAQDCKKISEAEWPHLKIVDLSMNEKI